MIHWNQELLVTADLTYQTHGKLTSEGKTTHIIATARAEKLFETAVKRVHTINCNQLKAEASKLHPPYKKKNMFPFKYAIDNF